MTSALLSLSGTLSIRERIAIPPGAVATVKVVDAAGEVLAATAVETQGVPVSWSVSIDPESAPDPAQLLVWAALRTDVGWWGTLELAPLGEDDIVLNRIPD